MTGGLSLLYYLKLNNHTLSQTFLWNCSDVYLFKSILLKVRLWKTAHMQQYISDFVDLHVILYLWQAFTMITLDILDLFGHIDETFTKQTSDL